MSALTNVPALYAQIMKDTDFQSKLTAIYSPEAVVAEIQAYGRAHALPVSLEEIRAALTPPKGELSDQDLEQVVGGKSRCGTNINLGLIGLVIPINDLMIGGRGDDYCAGGSGADSVWGNGGNDELEGGDGNDYLNGGSGNDTMYGDSSYSDFDHSGNDHMRGGSGNDEMYGGDGNDYMRGDSGNDDMNGGDGNDTMGGDAGADRMAGDDGNDYMRGGDSNDRMWGGEGNDTIGGDAGDDFLCGGDGNDNIWGGDGNDTLYGDCGNDILSGGAGNDVFMFDENQGSDTITDFNKDEDKFLLRDISREDLKVTTEGGNTIMSFKGTTVTLQGVEMTEDEVWARVE